MNRVVITGMGAISPFGSGVKNLQSGLLRGASGLQYSNQLGFVVGSVQEESADFNRWSSGQKREMSRASQLALLAAEEALISADAVSISHHETLVNIGTGVADLMAIGETAQMIQNGQTRKISPYFVPRILNNLPSGYVAMRYNMMGGVESSSTACATGLHCIGNAFRAVRHGWARRAVGGAAEGCVNSLALAGFDRMRALAQGQEPSISCPFDKNRKGFVLSEGVGILFLERLEDALHRGVPILAEVVGYGISSDCYHISSPHPSGIGARLSMKRALDDARISPSEVSYVNAHATSTPTGDAIEAKAIRELFPETVEVSSIKGHIGHLLAAAGAVETIATISAICERKLPPNLNLKESDIEGVRFLRSVTPWNSERRVAVINSFGFGGTNASLVLRNYI